MKVNFDIIILEEANDFIRNLDIKCQQKVLINLKKAQKVKDVQLFKKLKGSNMWEFRTSYNNMQYRLLAFWHKEHKTFVICTNGFIKKSQKTPLKEIRKAESIRLEYLSNI
ncbi:type II toxin-antitoxin system RelE/ParE family toxin [Puteibacter caeruleilacunae]|nr:type II toxin-antitoxin system RelE/ParE family toxin [Puteibacter caeruleilacunae]